LSDSAKRTRRVCTAQFRREALQLLDHEVTRVHAVDVTVNSALSTAFLGAQVLLQGRRPHHTGIGAAASLRDRLRELVGEVMGFESAVAQLE